MDTAARIQLILDAKGMSVKELADRADLRMPTIYPWLHGSVPRGNSLAKLAKGLEVSTDFLLGIVNYPGEEPRKIAARESRAIFLRMEGIDPDNSVYNLYEKLLNQDSPPVDVNGWKSLHAKIIPTIIEYFALKQGKTKRLSSKEPKSERDAMFRIQNLKGSSKVLPISRGSPRK